MSESRNSPAPGPVEQRENRALWFEPVPVGPAESLADDAGNAPPLERPAAAPAAERPALRPRARHEPRRQEIRRQEIKWIEPKFVGFDDTDGDTDAAEPGKLDATPASVPVEPQPGPAASTAEMPAEPGGDAEPMAALPSAAPERDHAAASVFAAPSPPRRHPLAGRDRAIRGRRIAVIAAVLVAALVGILAASDRDLRSGLGRALRIAPNVPGGAPTVGPAASHRPARPAGPPADPAARVAYFLARAKAGDPAAEQAVAVLYAEGNGVAQDYASAAAWFREAAINGVVNAQYNLAVLYERGLGVPANISEALIWYHSAADRNHPSAQYNLALAYAEGRGTPQDFVEAAAWYHRAAEQGIVPAMVNFAILYERGDGVAASPVDAYAWYRAAAAHGDAVADKRAGELFQKFSDADKAGATALAATIAASIHGPLPELPAPSPAAATTAKGPAPTLEQGWGRGSAAEPAGIDPLPPRTEEVAPSPRAISEIQRRLARLDITPGPVDGITGQATVQAIRRYQQAQGLPADGTASAALLNYMRSTAAPSPPAARRAP